MSILGIVFDFSHYVATVHYRTCHFYRIAVRKDLPLTDHTKVRLCRACRPDPDDVVADPPEVRWFEYGPGVAKQTGIPLEFAEKLVARRDLGIGRRSSSGRRWED